MALREEMVRQGSWLFRWRSYLPLLLLLPMLVAMGCWEGALRSARVHEYWKLACLLVSMTGFGLRVTTTGFAPNGTSGRNTRRQVAKTLNTTGVYSVVRHPLYLANFLIWLGMALYGQVWWLVVIYVLAFWLYYERIMLAEEEFLRDKFGAEFEAWAARTPTFWPRFSQWTTAAPPFSMRRILRKENSSFLAMATAYTVLDLVRHFLLEHRLVLEPAWGFLMAIALVIYGILRTLKRRTPWLRTPGDQESMDLPELLPEGQLV